MPMAGSNSTTQNVNSGGTSTNPGAGAVANNNIAVGSNKTWELSDYELHRTPQDAVTDGSEIAVSPRALHSELMCPICLDMLHQTMTTKECLHRFCAECIITALRSGNKECPTCRKKLVSKRSLRPDPNFDMLISKIYPSRDEYEAQQQKAMARLSKSHNQLALASSIEEGMKAQSQMRKVTKPSGKGNGSANQNQQGMNSDVPDGGSSNNAEGNSAIVGNTALGNNLVAPGIPNTPLTNNSSVNINSLNGGLLNNSTNSANSNAIGPVGTLGINQLTLIAGAATNTPIAPTNTTTTLTNNTIPGASNTNPSHLGPSPTKASRTDSVGGDNSSNTSGFSDEVTEVELVFKPHPDMFNQGSIPSAYTQTRYIKTSANASVEHLTKYLGMRLALDSQMDTDTDALHNCTIYVSPHGNTFVPIPLTQTLTVVCEKFWRFNKPLEMYYSWKKIN